MKKHATQPAQKIKLPPEAVHWPEDEEVVTVSEVVGEGFEAHRIVRVGPWTLVAAATNGEEPRIRDIDLAERLEFSRPRDIRKLIRSLATAGKLNDLHHRDAAARADGQVAARPEREYWLTEAQALKVVAKSETAKADAILDEVIRVFILARKGLLPQQLAPRPYDPASLAVIAEAARAVVAEMLLPVREELARIRQDVATIPHGVITGLQADELRRTVEYLAMGLIALGRRGSTRAAKSYVYERLKAAIAWGFRGTQIHTMPAAKYAEAVATLRGMKQDIEHDLKTKRRKVAAKKQAELFDKDDPAKKPN
jgi:hypothetical protein